MLVWMVMFLVACTSPAKDLFPPDKNTPVKSIYLVRHGWHAGIVVKRTDIPAGVWSEHNDFPDADYLEVGWGDKDYYMTPDAHVGIAIKAGVLPTASVLHVVGFSAPVTSYFPYSEIVRIDLSAQGFERLCRYIQASYAKDDAGASQVLGTGLYGHSRFYLSRETYHAFKTCNVWTARALREAGCPLTPSTTLTVDGLMSQVAELGTLLQSRPTPP